MNVHVTQALKKARARRDGQAWQEVRKVTSDNKVQSKPSTTYLEPHFDLQCSAQVVRIHEHVHKAVDQHAQARKVDTGVAPRPCDQDDHGMVVPMKEDEIALLQYQNDSVDELVEL